MFTNVNLLSLNNSFSMCFVSSDGTHLGFQLFNLMLNIINVLSVLQAFILNTPGAFYQIQRHNRHTICLEDSAKLPL